MVYPFPHTTRQAPRLKCKAAKEQATSEAVDLCWMPTQQWPTCQLNKIAGFRLHTIPLYRIRFNTEVDASVPINMMNE